MTDNKKFWKTIKPFFSNKGLNSNKLMLREKDVVVADEKALATLMNNYFVNVTADLDLKRDSENFYDTPASVYNIKKKFQDHQSVLKIKKAFNVTDLFSFHEITEDEIRKEISKLDGSKATPVGDIPAEMLKSTTDVHVSLLTKIINSSIRNGCFPDELKAAEVTPIFKKNDDLDKENYRPVSVLPHVSKIIERVMYTQIENFMEDKLSKLLTGFRKNHSTQHSLVNMLEKWKNTLDKGGFVCAIFMDLSKAFDTMNHDLLIAKLGAYGFQEDALVFMKSYFTNRQQRVRVNSNFSMWEKIISGVPQGSILGPLLFNIFLNDLFLFVENSDLSNYADDNTLYSSGNDLEKVKQTLRQDFEIVTKWFYENYMVLNSDKCHFMCLGQNTVNETFVYDNTEMKNSKEEKILGVIIDNKLRFKSHVKNLCKKASQKIWALSRLINYLNDSKKKIIFNALIKSQFSYCPLVWMFCSRQTNNMINKIHERALRIVLNDHFSDFETMLLNMNDITIHHRNIQTLMIELFKIKYDLAPPIMDSLLNRRTICYNFRNLQEFPSERKRTVFYSLETISYRAPQLWTIFAGQLGT